uniref:Cytochrome c oxidase assembly factor 3 mitochondrial coiled-coil domain-containing protein n=1 Tax=Leersia perrieri TaxID=77586 RepID=A0A0D9WBS1_9ORYZ
MNGEIVVEAWKKRKEGDLWNGPNKVGPTCEQQLQEKPIEIPSVPNERTRASPPPPADKGRRSPRRGFGSLAPKTKNMVVAGGLSAFVLGVYYYTMKAVGGTDELQVAIDKFQDLKKKDAGDSSTAGS